MILFFPLVQFAMLVSLLVWWIVVVAGLYSAGTVSEKEGGGYDLAWDDTLRYFLPTFLASLLASFGRFYDKVLSDSYRFTCLVMQTNLLVEPSVLH
jgi:peptidoglycan/LPS O-acetylase OafA/YrhL